MSDIALGYSSAGGLLPASNHQHDVTLYVRHLALFYMI